MPLGMSIALHNCFRKTGQEEKFYHNSHILKPQVILFNFYLLIFQCINIVHGIYFAEQKHTNFCHNKANMGEY
jgi:hypothetical protein